MPNDDTAPAGSDQYPEESENLDGTGSTTQHFLSVHVPYNASAEVIVKTIADALLVKRVELPFFPDRTVLRPITTEPEISRAAVPATQEAEISTENKVDYKALLILVQEEGGVLGSDS